MENLLSRNNLMMGAVLITLYLVWKSTKPMTPSLPAETA